MVGGSAAIGQPNAQALHISQHTDKAIINWKGFSIDINELVKFAQPSAGSIALNRVTGADPSSILGKLMANGRIFLVNPNGVFFGPSSVVDVAGLLATTFDIKDSDFMAGKFHFEHDPTKTGSFVINKGQIKVSDNGFVFLVASQVSNDGLIIANLGKAVMASGEKFTVDFMGDGLITFAVDGAVLSQVTGSDGQPLTSAVSNTGEIRADGGQVLLTAKGSSQLLASVINQSGIIEARSLVNHGGVIRLEASDPVANTGEVGWRANLGRVKNAEGEVVHTGTLDVSAAEAGAAQGEVTLSGQRVSSSGAILARGTDGAQGGRVLITSSDKTVLTTSSLIDTSGIGNSSAGNAVVWSDQDTIFAGTVLAKGGERGGDGGHVEVSGHDNLNFYGFVDASAPYGARGTLLLDPKNITVATGGPALLTDVDEFTDTPAATVTISPATINAALANVTLQANNDITFTDAVSVAEPGVTLAAQAGRSIFVDNNITTNKGALTLVANDTGAIGDNRDAGAAVITMADGTTLNAGNANISITLSTGSTSGNITLESLTTTGDVLVVNNGSGSDILRASDDALITASSVALDVNGATNQGLIGADANSPIRIQVTNVEARGRSGVFLESVGQGVTVGGAALGGLTGLSTQNSGQVRLQADGTITVNEDINSKGDIRLDALGSTSDILVNATITDPGNIRNIDLRAGRDITPGGSVTITGKGLRLEAANAIGTVANPIRTNANFLAAALTGAMATGDIFITEDDSVTIQDTVGGTGELLSGVTTTNNRDITVQTIDGNLTVNNPNKVDAGAGIVSLAARGTDKKLAIGNGAKVIGTGGVTMIGDRIDIAPGTTNEVNAGDATATFVPHTGGGAVAIDLGGSDASGTLGLTSDELNKVTAGILEVGDASSGDVSITTAVAPAGTSTLSLQTGGTITQDAGATIAETNLALRAGGAITLNEANNDVTTLAASANGAFSYTNANALTIGTVDGVTGVSGSGVTISNTTGDMTLGTVSATAGGISLTANGGSILDGNGAANNLCVTANSTLTAGSTIGRQGDSIEVNMNGTLGVSASGQVENVSVNVSGTTANNTLNVLNSPPGQVIFNGSAVGGDDGGTDGGGDSDSGGESENVLQSESGIRATSYLNSELVNEDGFFAPTFLNVLDEFFFVPQQYFREPED